MTSSVRSPEERHWEEVYRSTPTVELSWFTEHPSTSLELIRHAAPNLDSRIIDVGGGDSLLVDHLLDAGYRQLSVLDISGSALERARTRLGARAEAVTWIVDDVLAAKTLGTYDVWHDRALLHFMVDRRQRDSYVATLLRTLAPGGAAVLGTFAPDGPERCSGLRVRRYGEEELASELGEQFTLVEARREAHPHPRERGATLCIRLISSASTLGGRDDAYRRRLCALARRRDVIALSWSDAEVGCPR